MNENRESPLSTIATGFMSRYGSFSRTLLGPRELVLLVTIVVLCIAMYFVEPRFLSLGNLRAILVGSAMEFVLVVAVVFLMVFLAQFNSCNRA